MVQFYERSQSDSLVFAEPANVTHQPNKTVDYNSSLVEAANLEDAVTVELLGLQLDRQAAESEMYAESTDDASEIQDLITDIEASLETDEQEIAAELLIGILTLDYGSLGGIEIFDMSLLNPAETTVPIEGRIEISQNAFDKFTAFLEKYEPDVRTQAAESIISISEIVNELNSESRLEEEVNEQLIVELEERIYDLFSTLGIKLEDKQAQKFVELLLLILEKDQSVKREYDIDYLNGIGTREYKPLARRSILGGLTQLASNELKNVELIGKYTVQVSMA